MALERQGIIHAPTGNQPDLEALVLSHPKVQRELFWADVAETRLNSDGSQNGTLHFWQAQQCWGSLWQLSETDLAWLQEDLARPPTPADRFTALTAIVHIRTNSGSLAAEQDSLRCLLGSQSDLLEYLDRWLTLPPESESLNRLCAEREAQRAACEEAARSAEMRERERWLSLRSRLTADPSLLLVSEHPDDADCSIALLASLTRWLSRSTRKSYIEAAPQWRLIGRVFGEPVAEAYREGLRKIWRMTEPDVPRWRKDGVSRTWPVILSVGGLGVEAAGNPQWASSLSALDASRAAKHGCFSSDDYPDWFGALAEAHPNEALPVLREALCGELHGEVGEYCPVLSKLSCQTEEITPAIRGLIAQLAADCGALSEGPRDHLLSALAKVDLGPSERDRLIDGIRRRIHVASGGKAGEEIAHSIVLLLLVDLSQGTRELVHRLSSLSADASVQEAQRVFALLTRYNIPVANTLTEASVASLECLARTACKYVLWKDDVEHRGEYTPSDRDYAEEARGRIVKALLACPGAEAYRAVRRLEEDGVSGLPFIRYMGLAHGKAEEDAEPPPWTPKEVRGFEERHLLPVKTGEALLDVAVGILADIAASGNRQDAASLHLLRKAEDEGEVQKWLAEQLAFHSGGRFQVHRETKIARADRPDIVLSASPPGVEVAIEVKHGGKSWSCRDLQRALAEQLAGRYLKPGNRKWGILVVTHHGGRQWKHPTTGKLIQFSELREVLRDAARELTEDSSVPGTVRFCGIDATSY
jgi:hypothetical protein